MNKTLVLNAAWLLAAAGAFVLGRFSVAPSDSSPEAGGRIAQAAPTLLDGAGPAGEAKGSSAAEEVGAADSSAAGPASDDPAWLQQKDPLSAEQMENAMRDVMGMSDPVRRSMLLTQLAQRLTPENAAVAYQTLREESTGFESMQSLGLITYAWGAVDGAGALKAVQEGGDRGMEWMAASAISGWAAKDPDSALKWLESQEAGTVDRRLSFGLVRGLAQNDPQRATDYVMGLEGDEGKDFLIRSIAGEQVKGGLDQAANWAMQLPADLKVHALDSVAETFARRDPAAAAKWIESMAADESSTRAVGQIAEQLARSDASNAVQWLQNLPDGAPKNQGFQQVFQEWARTDPNAAGSYLEAMPASDSRDHALLEFSGQVAREDPAVAVQWASTIANEEMRVDAMVRSAQRWYRQDPDAAGAWAAQTLPAERQEEVISQPQGGEGGPPWMRR